MLPLPPFEWIAPRTLDAALDALAAAPGESLLLAGGTDAVPNLKRGLGTPRRVIGLGAIAELARIEPLDDGGLWLGAGLTLDRIARDPLVSERYPALAVAAASAASPQVRRMGTLGGNLCLDTRCAYYDQSAFWRGALGHCLKTTGDVCHVAGGRRCVAALAADTPAPLIAYQAIVELRSRRGVRRLPLLELYGSDGAHHLTRAPDEIVTGVALPAPAAGLTSSYLKLRARGSIDFPLLSVAAAVDARDARVVIAALGPKPRLVRLPAAAAAATASRPLSPDAVEAIVGAARAQCHPLATLGAEGWRTELVPTMVKRALATLVTLVAMIAPARADVLGVVRDEAGQPVSGARVSREASGAAVTTGVDGAFVLPHRRWCHHDRRCGGAAGLGRRRTSAT